MRFNIADIVRFIHPKEGVSGLLEVTGYSDNSDKPGVILTKDFANWEFLVQEHELILVCPASMRMDLNKEEIE